MDVLLKPMNCPHHCEIYNLNLIHIKIYQNDLQNLEQFIDMNKVRITWFNTCKRFCHKMMRIFLYTRTIRPRIKDVIDLVLYVFDLCLENLQHRFLLEIRKTLINI
jgi:threonyl-tRNA synthetase